MRTMSQVLKQRDATIRDNRRLVIEGWIGLIVIVATIGATAAYNLLMLLEWRI